MRYATAISPAMLVACPDCARSYQLAADEIGEHGRVVVCPRCDARWFQGGERSEEVAPPPAPFRAAVPPRRRRIRSFALALAVPALAATLIGARAGIVAAVPRAASLYAAAGWPVNLRGLDIARLRPEVGADGTVLTGEIRNVARRRVRVPRLAFAVRDDAGAVLASWSEPLPAATLGAGRTLAFATLPRRLPPGGRTVLARFADEAAVP